jgi:glycosyltransferase involved in cell wall biosynthesis
MKKISVIITMHNNERTVEKTIKSLLLQNYPRHLFEIICIDNGSTDNSLNVAQILGADLIVKQRRENLLSTRINGASRSSGEIIFFIDGDIYLRSKNSFKIILSHFEKNPKLAGVCGNYKSAYKNRDGNICRDIRRQTLYKKNDQKFLITLQNFTTFSGGFGALRRSIFEELKINTEIFYNCAAEDLFVEILALQRGYVFLYDPEIKGIHDHRLSLIETLKKMIYEVRGKANILIALIEREEKEIYIPFLRGCFSYPLTFLISLILLLLSFHFWPFLFFSFLSEIIPVLRCLSSKNTSLNNKILAVGYCFFQNLISIFYLPYYLIKNKKKRWKMGEIDQLIKNILRWEGQKWLCLIKRE